jgi:N-acetylmuramoyl-L-alanine amidase
MKVENTLKRKRRKKRMSRVVFDAGHGGRDRFNVGPGGYVEADATLIMATAAAKKLGRNGVEVDMTRQIFSQV